jgi:hypothetical protein
LTAQPVVPLQLFSCTRGNNSLLGCYHATHGAAFSQSARFLSDWQAQAGSILRCRAARPPTPPNENLRSFGRHFPLVFEARGFRRYTFDHGSNVRPPNHFGQWVLVLYQFCTSSVRTYSCPLDPCILTSRWTQKKCSLTKIRATPPTSHRRGNNKLQSPQDPYRRRRGNNLHSASAATPHQRSPLRPKHHDAT